MVFSMPRLRKKISKILTQLLLREAEAAEAIRLRAEASNFKDEEKGKRELTDLNALITFVKSQNDNLVDQVHELETSSSGLQEKVTVYKNCMDQLEKFQDDRMKVVNDKFDKLYTNFVEMALHLEEKIKSQPSYYQKTFLTDVVCRILLGNHYTSALQQHPKGCEFLFELAELKSKHEPLVRCGFCTGTKGTSDIVPATTNTNMALSITFASASSISPISVDGYEVVSADDQAVADGNAASFPNVDDAELNIPQ
ncbi:hypothetical protein Tco_0291684 [Tanacetum coccineum]